MTVHAERVRTRAHRGQTIVEIDFSGLSPGELDPVIGQAAEVIRHSAPKSLHTLTLVKGAHFNTEVVEMLQQFAKENDPYVKSGAIVGLAGLQKLVLNAVAKFSKREFHVCDSVEDALERLTG